MSFQPHGNLYQLTGNLIKCVLALRNAMNTMHIDHYRALRDGDIDACT
jgi:hypothetical protein